MAAALPDGWMGKKGRRWMGRHAAESRRIIEVGVWKGRSTLTMAEAMPKGACLWAVDTWAGTPDDESQHELYAEDVGRGGDSVFGEFMWNLSRYIESGRVIPVRMDSVSAAEYLMREHGPVFDFVFIDADHSYRGASADIAAYRPLVRAGGVLAGHDFHWPGVERAVRESLPMDRVELGPKSIWSIRL